MPGANGGTAVRGFRCRVLGGGCLGALKYNGRRRPQQSEAGEMGGKWEEKALSDWTCATRNSRKRGGERREGGGGGKSGTRAKAKNRRARGAPAEERPGPRQAAKGRRRKDPESRAGAPGPYAETYPPHPAPARTRGGTGTPGRTEPQPGGRGPSGGAQKTPSAPARGPRTRENTRARRLAPFRPPPDLAEPLGSVGAVC